MKNLATEFKGRGASSMCDIIKWMKESVASATNAVCKKLQTCLKGLKNWLQRKVSWLQRKVNKWKI